VILIELGRRDAPLRDRTIDTAAHQLGDEPRIAERLFLGMDIELGEKRVVEVPGAFTGRDSFPNGMVVETFPFEPRPKLRFGQPPRRKDPQCGELRAFGIASPWFYSTSSVAAGAAATGCPFVETLALSASRIFASISPATSACSSR